MLGLVVQMATPDLPAASAIPLDTAAGAVTPATAQSPDEDQGFETRGRRNQNPTAMITPI